MDNSTQTLFYGSLNLSSPPPPDVYGIQQEHLFPIRFTGTLGSISQLIRCIALFARRLTEVVIVFFHCAEMCQKSRVWLHSS